jgi:hypothetical protein
VQLPLPLHLQLQLPVLLQTQNIVISTEGGALAAAVERSPHFAFAVASPHYPIHSRTAQCRHHISCTTKHIQAT